MISCHDKHVTYALHPPHQHSLPPTPTSAPPPAPQHISHGILLPVCPSTNAPSHQQPAVPLAPGHSHVSKPFTIQTRAAPTTSSAPAYYMMIIHAELLTYRTPPPNTPPSSQMHFSGGPAIFLIFFLLWFYSNVENNLWLCARYIGHHCSAELSTNNVFTGTDPALSEESKSPSSLSPFLSPLLSREVYITSHSCSNEGPALSSLTIYSNSFVRHIHSNMLWSIHPYMHLNLLR